MKKMKHGRGMKPQVIYFFPSKLSGVIITVSSSMCRKLIFKVSRKLYLFVIYNSITK